MSISILISDTVFCFLVALSVNTHQHK